MSDHADMLEFNTPDAQRVGAKLLSHLIAEEIVLAEVTNGTLGDAGHPPGPQLAKATAESKQVLSLSVNGVAFEYPSSGELYFSPEGGDPWVTCPRCRRQLEQEDLMSHLNDRHEAQQPTNPSSSSVPLSCSGCQGEWDLSEWTTHECAFGTLACFFWNWPLRTSFIDQVLLWTGTPLVRIGYMI